MILTSTTLLDFGRLTVGEESTKTFTVFNDNNITVNITLTSSVSQFVSIPTSIAIGPNSSTLITVKFFPDSETTFSGTLTIVNDDPSDLEDDIINLVGHGIKATIDVTPVLLDYGSVSVEDTKNLTINIQNTNTEGLLKVTNIVSNEASFSASSTSFNLNAGQSKIVNVSFSPLLIGTKTGKLTIFNNSSNNDELEVNLTGVAESPTYHLSRTSIDFGEVTLNTSKVEDVVLSNTSTNDINLKVTSVFTNNSRFRETISTFVIEKDSALNIPISFLPLDTSIQAGKLFIETNAGTLEVKLEGKGIASPNISISTTSLNFGKVGLGNTSQKKFRINNTGVIDLNVSQIFSSSTKFVVNPLSAVISPNSFLEFIVTFTASEPGTEIEKLTVVCNDPDTPNLEISLLGEGVSPEIGGDTFINFGKNSVNVSKTVNYILTNSGFSSLTVSSISSSNSVFSISTIVPFTINTQSAKTLQVVFLPTNAGTEVGTLSIVSNDYDTPNFEINLAGEGIIPNILIAPSSIDFGNVKVNETSSREILITNTGEAALVINSIASSNIVFSTLVSSLTVQPNSSKNLEIRFSPLTVSSQSGTITLQTNDPDSPNIVISLSGTGAQPVIVIDSTPLDFNGVARNDTKTLTRTIQNTGLVDLEIQTQVNSTNFSTNAINIVGANSSKDLEISFTPDESINFSATLTINTNDPASSLINIPLTGVGLDIARLSLSTSNLTFSQITAGSTQSKVFSILNQGFAPLEFTISIATNPIYIANPTSGSIPAGGSQPVTVIFNPTSAGSFTTTLTVSTPSDPNNPTAILTLSGSAEAGTLQWSSFSLENLVPSTLQEIATSLNETLSTITDALAFINGLLETLKNFIIDIQDPLKVIVEAILTAIRNFIEDISATGLYFLQIFPGHFTIGPNETPQYLIGMQIDLTDPNLANSLKEKYADEIDAGQTTVQADFSDLNFIFGDDPFDWFNNVKGGSTAFIRKILLSFDDPGDGARPQFSSDASAGAIVLAADSGDLTTLIEAIKRIANIFRLEWAAQFNPPTNITAIASNKNVRLTFTANAGILPNSYVIWRSETAGGVPQIESTENGKNIYKKDEYGRIVTRYDFNQLFTMKEVIAQMFNVSQTEAENKIRNAAGYMKGLLANAGQAFSGKFLTDDTTVENDKTYFYVVQAIAIDENFIDDFKSEVQYSDQLVRIRQANGEYEREIDPFDVGVLGMGEFSSEVSGQPRNAFEVVEGGLARCRNYRCTFDKEQIDERQITQSDKNSRNFTKNLSFTPVGSSSSALVTIKVLRQTTTPPITTTEVTIPSGDYSINGKIISFTKPAFFEVGDKLEISYFYREELEKKSRENETHTGISQGDVFQLDNVPFDISSLILYTNGTVLRKETDYEIVDEFRGKIKSLKSGANTFIADYDYYTNFGDDSSFRCINVEFNKYYFDVVKCNDGTTECPGYENRNCIFNNGSACTNTNLSKRKVTINSASCANVNLSTNPECQGISESLIAARRRISVPENIPFNMFYDPFYCQNGIMAQRCDGYAKVAPRLGYKGVPPDWISYRIVDLFPAIKDLVDLMETLVKSLLDSTEKLSDSLLNFIELIQQKIAYLQNFIQKIQNILSIISEDFQGPGFYLLKVPLATGGNEYIKNSIQRAQGGPSSDAFGYTAGVVMVYGGPNAQALQRALEVFF